MVVYNLKVINIEIINENQYDFKHSKHFQDIAEFLCELNSLQGDVELSLIIGDDNKLQEISNQYRDKNAPTDILSFPAGYKELKDIIGYNMLGDIFISYQMVERRAVEYGHSEEREWCYLFSHGLLHLLGFDHDTEENEKQMNDFSSKAMEKINVRRENE